jgi:hypothetical protein
MKNLFILGSLICLLSACSRYQIHTLSSLRTPKDEQTGDFIVKNDTLEIVYKFNGENGPVDVLITNKLNEPLYVNWKKSALIVGDKAISYSGNKIDLNGKYSGTGETGLYFPDTQIQSGKLTGSATLPEEITFIPPHARIEKKLLNVTAGLITLAKDSLKRLRVFSPDGLNSYIVNLAKFSRENSPLVLRSYITLYLEKDKNLQVFPYEEEFYISQSVVLSGKKPKNTEFYKVGRSDIFYNFEPTGYGKTMALVGGVAILGTLNAVSEETAPAKDK